MNDKIDEIIQNIEIKSLIALQRSREGGDPKHHKKMIKEARAAITALVDEARIDELYRLWPDITVNGSFIVEGEQIEERLAELQLQQESKDNG